jgi:hypothetical protein
MSAPHDFLEPATRFSSGGRRRGLSSPLSVNSARLEAPRTTPRAAASGSLQFVELQPVVEAEVVGERVVENLAVPTPVFEVDRGRVGALAVLVVTNRSVHGLSMD